MIGANLFLNFALPLLLKIGYGKHGKLQHGKLQSVFYCLPAVDPENLSISKLGLFVTIANDFLPLAIVVKISAEFLNLNMTTKDDQ